MFTGLKVKDNFLQKPHGVRKKYLTPRMVMTGICLIFATEMSRINHYMCLLAVSAVGFTAFGAVASEPSDTTASRHRTLAGFEVVGVKQLPSAEITATTSITPSMIRRYGISAVKDISEMAPNFYMPDYGSRMTSSVYVRGLGARMDQPVVGLNIDNVPVLNKDAYDFDVFDIERIEVLRGAQSLLNGRNTMGGQINVYTRSPWTTQGARFEAEYGSANSFKAGAGWYHRFSPSWGSALTARYYRSDGFFRNRYNNSRIGGDHGGAARWKLAWRPHKWLSLTNVAALSLARQNGYPYASAETGQIAYNDTCFYRRTTFSDGLTVAWAGKRVVVTSITSVQYLDDNMTLDQDFTPLDYFTLTQKRREWAVTQDLFTKGTRGSYGWLGGVFGLWRSSSMQAPVTFKDVGIGRLIEDRRNSVNPEYPIEWDSRNFVLDSDFDMTTGAFALYHQSTYNLGPWEFQVGLRFDFEKHSLDHHSFCDTGFSTYHILPDGSRELYRHSRVNIDDRGSLDKTYAELLPEVSVAYNADGWRAYLSAAKAYKSGGFNTQMFSDVLQQRVMQFMGLSMNYSLEEIVSYKPEKSWNFEGGVKTEWFDGRLGVDAVGFYILCRDQQLTMFPPGTVTGRIMTNAGRTTSRGAELSATYQPDERLSLRLSYGYTKATFTRFSDSRGDYAGRRLPYAPANTLFAGATYRLPLTLLGATPSVSADCRGAGNIYWDESNLSSQKFYALLGASLSLEHKNWSIKVSGTNLTSTRYSTFHFVSIGNTFYQQGKPRQFAVTLRYNLH